MRRADRLFQLIQLLRRKNVCTAAWLAGELEVSERTIYRDVRDLVLSGVPIEGEAGVGYIMRKGFDLPPLMFTESEIEAMVLGARVVTSYGDTELARAAGDALYRVESVLPDRLKHKIEKTPLFAPAFHLPPAYASSLTALRRAIDERRKVQMAYTDGEGAATERVVRPIGLFFWGNSWSVSGWCELRDDFRSFRLDRIRQLTPMRERFYDEAGKTIEDYLARRGESDF
jgi:predicted DNA-binding transcriptional regulator YafY